jgi:N-acetylmuramoyl-L-alanine amidase CwlA
MPPFPYPYPYIPAKYQKPGNDRTILWIVIHSTESLEVEGGAKNIAHYFQNPPRPGASHFVVDDKDIIQCVHDLDIAAGAVGANTNGLHVEQVGKAEQSAAEWADDYSVAVIANCAEVVAQWCLKWGIPVTFLHAADLQARKKGITTHAEVSKAFPGTGHTDPGVSYPIDSFLAQVQAKCAEYQATS